MSPSLAKPFGTLRVLVTAALTAGTAVAGVAAAAPVQLPSPACSWYGETDQRDVNIGAPDLDAHYWAAPLPVASGATVTIDGHYPNARYFSFHVYDTRGHALDSLYDTEISPAPGSTNPYRGPVAVRHGDSYRLTVAFSAVPRHRARNTLYAPATEVAGSGVALLVYRVYVPTDPASPPGGVAFPRLTMHGPSGVAVAEGACATTPPPFGSLVWSAAAAMSYPAGAPTPAVPGASRIPVWQRQFGSALGNQQNTYVATTIARKYGQLVVIHTRAPTFPNNRAGVPAYHKTQLRYWSFCVYDTQGQAGYGCAADYAAVIRGGWITYVISDPGVRPANADATHGVTWLPWGGTQNGAQIVYRNMLPAPTFRYAGQRITSTTQSAASVMGRYYPYAVYCSRSTFERGGWRACFDAARH